MIVEEALDEYPTITPRPSLNKMWEIPHFYHWCENIPFIEKIILNHTFAKISLGYELARGFLEGQDEILSHVDTLATSAAENSAVRADVLKNKQITYDYISNISAVFPEVICAIQTRTANRLLLNRERSVIKHLLETGVLDDPEAQRMTQDVENRMFALLKMPTKVSIPEISSLIKQASWTKDIKETTLNELIKSFEHHIFGKNEQVFTQDKKNDYLIVVVRGSVEIINEKTKAIEDIKSIGAVLGIDILFRQKSAKTVRTTLPTDVLFINIEKLKYIMKKDSTLYENLMRLLKS